MPDIWYAPDQSPTFNVGTILLLTDGSLFAQDDNTVNWWRLRPDGSGDYAKGSWSAAAPARYARRYFASAVLADGRVFVAGGKSLDDAGAPADLAAVEIYDPVADSWTDAPAPFGTAPVGNAPCCVLADGTVLIGNIATGDCAIFDPETNVWQLTGRKANGSAAEESWTLLQDGSVLTIDCTGALQSERYVAGRGWTVDAAPPATFGQGNARSSGPAVLLPDGRVFALGDTAVTAVFSPGANPQAQGSWAVAPPPPLPQKGGQALTARDAPACLLPDGSVLFVAALGTAAASKYLGGRCVLLKYDPTLGTITELPMQPGTADVPPQWTRLLLLPNGHVLFATSRSSLQFLKPMGAPKPEWRPKVVQVPPQLTAGEAYTLNGRQLNGLSQACAFGDDAGMATNYPLIRLSQMRGTVPTVVYCRTYGHSTMGVAPADDARTDSTGFTLPPNIKPGAYQLEVVANGIASLPLPVTVSVRRAEAQSMFATNGRDVSRDVALQDEMFWRDLNEVHLLMDYVSGRADKSLNDMTKVPDPVPGGKDALKPQEAIHRVCMIRFPPVGTAEDKADQAALLLLVKDQLNALAFPARGLSIAFTSLFATINTREEKIVGGLNGFGGVNGSQFRVQSGAGFALAAYPNLEDRAARFRLFFSVLPIITIIWLIVTSLISWDVLISAQTLHKVAAETAIFPGLTVNDTTCKITKNSGVPMLPREESDPAPTDFLAKCQTLAAVESGNENVAPGTYAARQAAAALFIGRPAWWHPVGIMVRLIGPIPKRDSLHGLGDTATTPFLCGAIASCRYEGDVADFAESVVNVFSNNILPMFFGVLGTLSGLMRSITAKVRESTLNPRDHRLSWSLIPMGAVAGLTVGLIIRPNAGSLGFTTISSLSATALSFLAGYGAEGFFTMLDGLLLRIFPPTPPNSSTPPK